jgi:two-component system NtrC family sensor kinase
VEKQFLDHSIKTYASFSPDVPLVYIVSDQIQQVFLNLVLNAFEAMPSGGALSIETSLNQDKVEIIFHDSGPGVPENHRKSIFEPFYSTKQGGTGLGLSISYGIITAHNGTLELVDHPIPGACFRISFKTGDS